MATDTKDTWSDTVELFRRILAARKITVAVACREVIGITYDQKYYTTFYHLMMRDRGDRPSDVNRLRIEKWCEEYAPFLQLTKKK